MKHEYVKSSPYFFTLIKVSAAALIALLLMLAVFIDAPLQGPADISTVPNPSKSAWFLMWTQELVSYSSLMVYLILGLGLLFLLFPWLPLAKPVETAQWFGRGQKLACGVALLVFVGILVLTVVAMFFRGENWLFVY